MGIILPQLNFCSLALGLLMKNIEIDEELYQYIVSNTQAIGESASSILRRLLALEVDNNTLAAKEGVVSLSVTNAKQGRLSQTQEETKTDLADTQINSDNAQASQLVSRESVFNFINKEELAMQRGAVGRFLLILAALYRANPDDFKVVI